MVIDVAGSHRDIIESLAVEESDLQSSNTRAFEPNVTLQVPNIETMKISSQKSLPRVLYFMIIFHIL